MCRVQSPAMIPTNTNEQKGTVMLDEFMKTIGDFVFAEDIPEKADIIFIPGNGYPEMAEHAARLYMEGYAYTAKRKVQCCDGAFFRSVVLKTGL